MYIVLCVSDIMYIGQGDIFRAVNYRWFKMFTTAHFDTTNRYVIMVMIRIFCQRHMVMIIICQRIQRYWDPDNWLIVFQYPCFNCKEWEETWTSWQETWRSHVFCCVLQSFSIFSSIEEVRVSVKPIHDIKLYTLFISSFLCTLKFGMYLFVKKV